MQVEKTWVVIVAALITAVATIIAAGITVDAKHDREQFQRALAEKSEEIEQLERQVSALQMDKQASSKPPSTTKGAESITLPDELDPALQNQRAPAGQDASLIPESTVTADQKEQEAASAEPIETIDRGAFKFALYRCFRWSDRVVCRLTVTNLTNTSADMNLCGASYLIDNLGRQPSTRVQFSGGTCGIFRLEQNLPRALEVSAQVPADGTSVNVVLADGNWFSFSGEAIFRDVKIDGTSN